MLWSESYISKRHSFIIMMSSNFPGNVHVYRNGRMHFAHHNRQERREQQRDVSTSLNLVRPSIHLIFIPPDLVSDMWLKTNESIFVFFLSSQGGLALFVQLMPILILIIVSALSQMMVTQPPYSLSYRP